MQVIAHLLQLVRPLTPGLTVTIANPPWQELLIRHLKQWGPHGLATISVAHRCEHQGQIVCAPEMLFEAKPSKKKIILTPYCFRDEATGFEQRSVYVKESRICVNYQLQSEHIRFARGWNRCLEQQGFVAAFHRSSFIRQLREAFAAEISADKSRPPEQLKQFIDRALSTALAQCVPNT